MARGQPNIDSMYAFIMLDPADNTEGIPAWTLPDGTHMPLVGADMDRVNDLRPLAQILAGMYSAPITLAHFTNRTDVEIIGIPDTPADAVDG